MHWAKSLRRRFHSGPHEALHGDRVPDAGIAAWENEGGSVGGRAWADLGPLATLLDNGKESAAELGSGTRRRAERARVALELRRLESRIASEIDGLGHDIFPLLRDGELIIELPVVEQRMKAIAEFQGEIDRRRAHSKAQARVTRRERARQESMANIDANATEEARAVQSAKDRTDEAGGDPAEQGGRG